MPKQLFIKKEAIGILGKGKQKKNTFFRKNCYIQLNEKKIYFNEIIDSLEFRKLYVSEQVKVSLQERINTQTARPFFDLSTHLRKKLNLVQGDLLIIRISKNAKIFELISILYKGGRIHVPQKVILELGINHAEKVSVDIINKTAPINQPNYISLTELLKSKKRVKLIGRGNGFVTLVISRHCPITIPNNIKLTPKLIETFFLIHGDGHYKYKLFFANKNPELHSFVIKTFKESLCIPPNIWRGRINLNKAFDENIAIAYWLQQVTFQENQLYPSVSKTEFNTSKYGNFRISIDYPIIAEIFRGIFSYMVNNLNSYQSLHALNGLLAAEGGAQVSKIGLHRVTLSYNLKEKKLFRKILSKVKLLHLFKDRYDATKGTFILENWKNFYPFFQKFLLAKIIPFEKHSSRKKKALDGMLIHSFTKTINKYLTAIGGRTVTVKELSKNLKIREDSCLRTIRKAQYSTFIDVSGIGINRNPFKISVSSEGKDFQDLILKLKREVKCDETGIYKKESRGSVW